MAFSIALDRRVPDAHIDPSGRLRLVTGAGAVRDRLFVALSTQLGEWFLDERDGVPYDQILGGKLTQSEVSAILRRRILLDPEVSRIDSLQVTQNAARQVSVTAEVQTTAGDSIYIEV